MADQTPAQEEDPFAAAFAQLTQPDKPVVVAADTVPATEEKPAPAAVADGKEPVTIEIDALPDPATVAGATPEEKPVPATEEKPAPAVEGKLSDTDFLERFRAIVAEKPAAAPAAAEKPASAITDYTPEQQGLVDAYMKEWPDVYAAEQLIRAREYQAFAAYIFDQFRPVLAQLQQQTGQTAQQLHMEQLQTAIPDYDEVVPKVLEWVDKQPAYMKQAFSAVTKQGSIADVVDLVGRYRVATGTEAPKPAAAVTLVPAVAAKPAPAARAVKGLAPVGSKRSGVQTEAIDKGDYDGAFNAFANAAAGG